MDDASFSKLLVSNQQALYDHCRKLTRHKERAEDLQQETNARAWTKRHLYKTDDSFIAWLKTVARNFFLNQIKKEALLPMKTVPFNGDGEYDGGDSVGAMRNAMPLYDQVQAPNQEDFWLENRIMDLIATLPEHQALLVQKKLQGMTYTQIAKPLGIKANNAKQRYFNVVKELRLLLEEHGLLED